MRTAPWLLAALLASPAAAGQLAGVTLPDQIAVSGRALVLNGMGLREATVLMVDVYVAGLYVETKTSDPQAILKPDQPKRLVMRFLHTVSKEKLADAWTEGFDKNAGERRAELAPGLAALNRAMADVKKGDVVTLTYLPDAGVAVDVKGTESPAIPGEDFQRVLFSIWLGASPPNVSLREGLLGRAAAR
jgi:hypothetical protein